jgi:hypothetical protein
MPEPAGSSRSDAQLLERLADALTPCDLRFDRQPTDAGLTALRTALDTRTRWPAGTPTGTVTERWRSWSGRSRKGLAALGLIGGVCVGGTGAAFAAGAPLPPPVRAVAHDLGLPVRSPWFASPRHGQPALSRDPASPAATPTGTPARVRNAGKLTSAAGPGLVDASDQPAGSPPPQLNSQAGSFGASRGLPRTGPYAPEGRRQTSTPATNAPDRSGSSDRDGQRQPLQSSQQSPSSPRTGGYPSGGPSSPGSGGTTQTTDGRSG